MHILSSYKQIIKYQTFNRIKLVKILVVSIKNNFIKWCFCKRVWKNVEQNELLLTKKIILGYKSNFLNAKG